MKDNVRKALKELPEIGYVVYDALEEKELAMKYKVRGAPILIYLENDVQKGFLNGLHSTEAIIEMIKGV